MNLSPEEFFMYLTIALVILVPASARVYRYLTAKQVTRMVHEEFGRKSEAATAEGPSKTNREGT
jgi:hypothetical protein